MKKHEQLPLAKSTMLKTAVLIAFETSRGTLAADDEPLPDLLVTYYIRLTEGVEEDDAISLLIKKVRQRYKPDRVQFVGWVDGVVGSGGSPQVLRLNGKNEIYEASY